MPVNAIRARSRRRVLVAASVIPGFAVGYDVHEHYGSVPLWMVTASAVGLTLLAMACLWALVDTILRWTGRDSGIFGAARSTEAPPRFWLLWSNWISPFVMGFIGLSLTDKLTHKGLPWWIAVCGAAALITMTLMLMDEVRLAAARLASCWKASHGPT